VARPTDRWRGCAFDFPSIWESDGNPQLFSAWVQSQTSLSNSIFLATKVQNEIGSKVFQPLTLGTSEGVSGNLASVAAQNSILAAFGLPPVLTLFYRAARSAHRAARYERRKWLRYRFIANTTIVLTREIIEQALQSSSGGGQSALMTVTFADNFTVSNGVLDLPGTYLMVLEVERQ